MVEDIRTVFELLLFIIYVSIVITAFIAVSLSVTSVCLLFLVWVYKGTLGKVFKYLERMKQ